MKCESLIYEDTLRDDDSQDLLARARRPCQYLLFKLFLYQG